ncbi:high mobility group box domain-containing protein, partial [Sporodiniella umbellata]
DNKYKQKHNEIKKRMREIEKLHKARKSIRHLKLERGFLLDKVEKSGHHAILDDNSEQSDITSDLEDETDSIFQKYHQPIKNQRSMTTKQTQPRKRKDPNAPKGPGNVFFLYCRMERDKIKDECQTENLGEVTRILGQKWKGLTQEEKQKYQDLYKRELEEHEEAMKAYTSSNSTPAVMDSAASSPIQSIEDPMISIQPQEDASEVSLLAEEKETVYPAQTEPTIMSWQHT